MKHLTTLLTMAITFTGLGQCLDGETELTFHLYDSYGDGWDYYGNEIYLLVEAAYNTSMPAIEVGRHFDHGPEMIEAYCVPSTECLQLELAGYEDLYDNEISFEVYRDGVLVFHLGVGCPACVGNYPIEYNPTNPYSYINFDGSCADHGCTDAEACNYDETATIDDGSCEFTSCAGCTLEGACNYDPEATIDDGSCIFGGPGATLFMYDTFGDGWNANTLTIGDEEFCFPDAFGDCTTTDVWDIYSNEVSFNLCLDLTQCLNVVYNGNGLYQAENSWAIVDADGVTIASGGAESGVVGDCGQGCTDPTACNYDPDATIDDGSCAVNDDCGVCGGTGIPDDECDCDGNVLDALGECGGTCEADDNNNGVCDAIEVPGCLDINNPLYNPNANVDDGSCLIGGCTFVQACNYDPLAEFQELGSCDFESCAGCSDEMACNYDPTALYNDGSCTYDNFPYDCDGICDDVDDDGVCDELEIPGCIDATACNYNDAATDDAGNCVYADEYYDCDGNCLNDADGDGVCDELEVEEGCTDDDACNYDSTAIIDDGSCLSLDECGVCGGDNSSCSGCTHENATNYDSTAIFEDGSCLYNQDAFEATCGPGTIWDVETQSCLIANPSDTNFDGCVSMTDLLDLLSVFGTCNETPWTCGNPLEYQGYDYETVLIGEQCWFAENLRAESYRDGDTISGNLSNDDWSTTLQGAVTFYNNAPSPLLEYGRLYNGYATQDPRGLCPQGWQIPSDDDWTVMTNLFGGLDSAGLAMKSLFGWSNDGGGNNSSGFDALPGGSRYNDGVFNGTTYDGYWWSSTLVESTAWFRQLEYDKSEVIRQPSGLNYGFSVRCIRDSE
ncbi:MAG: hypothetical protein CL835_06650 [Crocinitomicaceae bacterium]|nr:hypothetical protein [Crocinitomicaceae bacterium]